MQHRRGVAFAGIVATAALTFTAAPAAAGPVSPSQPAEAGSTIPAGMLVALERDLGLTAEQAETRIANEQAAAEFEPELRASLGSAYAGSWMAGETAELIVATTEETHVGAIEEVGAKAKLVKHSLAELESIKGNLDEVAEDHADSRAPVWYVDVTSNTVVLRAQEATAANDFLLAAGVDPAAVSIVASTEQPRALNDLRGGDAYYINNSGRCSIGFSVTQGTQQGFATAGHCGQAGASTQGHNRVAQGTFQGSIFPGRDMAWVATNSNWTVTPYVAQGGTNVTVTGSTQAPVGSSICRSGSTTGWHCGTIQQHNTSVTYPEGTITGVTRTSVCAEPGDSGGSYISGSQAQGVTSGGSGDCRTGGTTYHQPINPILSQYGLTLVR